MGHKPGRMAALLAVSVFLLGTCISAVADLMIPSSLQIIGEAAFQDDSSICGAVILPEQVREVGKDAFTGTDLFSLTVPETTVSAAASNVDSLVYLRFRGRTTQAETELLRSAQFVIGVTGSNVELAAKNAGVPFFSSADILEKDGWLYRHSGSGILLLSAVDNRKISETFIIPSEINNYPVTGVDSWAFSGCGRLKTLRVPKSGKKWTLHTPASVTVEYYDDTCSDDPYMTLKIGYTGTAVLNLTTALAEKGYLAEATDRYMKDVFLAVMQFQSDNSLPATGIADSATQEKLYGRTSAENNTDQLTMTLYPAEKIDWWTGGINELWAKGANYKIYDVKTGIIWWAHRWSGGYHADIEPLTAEDTARLCRIYGVNSAEEIESRNLYQRRPCLVTIDNRTFACSLYGIPHNPDGDTIADNDMTGQICLHFTNSWTHGSKKMDADHAKAIQSAWEHAPNGHK